MYTNNHVNAAIPLARKIGDAKMKLVALPNTPLSILVNSTVNMVNHVDMAMDKTIDTNTPASDDYYYNSVANSLNEAACVANNSSPDKNPMALGVDFNSAFDNIVDVASKAVLNHLSFARTVVSPVIQELVTTVQDHMQKVAHDSLASRDIKKMCLPCVFQNGSFIDSIERFSDTKMFDVTLNLKLPDVTIEQLIELLKTGASSVDKDIAVWAASLGNDWLMQTWVMVFKNGSTRGKVLFHTLLDCVNTALFTYLISQNLIDNPMEGVEMSLSMYNDSMADYRNQSGLRVWQHYYNYNSNIENSIMVLGFESEAPGAASNSSFIERSYDAVRNKVTVVNATVYDKWIADGGDVDILFGNSLLDRPFITVSTINANSVELKDKWCKLYNLNKVMVSNTMFTKTIQIIKAAFYAQLNEAAYELSTTSAEDRARVMQMFEDQLKEVIESDLNDLWVLCTKLVCRSRFYKTNAECILLDIENISKKNPGISVREAAAMATINYVTTWVTSQMMVQSA